MTDDARDDDVVELTPDLIARDGGEPPAPQVEAPRKKPRPPPSNPFTLLTAPRTEEKRREERPSPAPEERRDSRTSFVPEPRADAVAAIPIRRLGDEAKTGETSTPLSGKEQPAETPQGSDVETEREPEPGGEGEADDEILDLGQEYVVDGQVSDAEVGTEPISLVGGTLPPAAPAAQATPLVDAARLTEPAPSSEQAAATVEIAGAHPFDFGTPEMVFDRVAGVETATAEEEDLEEVDDAELEEETAEAEPEPEGEEIDLAEVVEVAPPSTAGPLPLLAPLFQEGTAPRRRRRKASTEWWASIFDDDFLAVMPAHSKRDLRRDLDLIADSLGVEPGGLVLDLACGAGRHAIGMARRNYRVVGVDLSLSMLARAGELAQEAGQKINFIHGDMRDLGFDQTFDGVYCLGTSFGYFDDPVNVKVIEGVHHALKPGGFFLLEIANRDHAITSQPNLLWFEMGDVVSMEETDFNYINSRLYVNRQIILDGGQRQTKHEYSVRLYALHEIGQILHNCGFAVTRVSGHVASPGAFFGVDSERLIIVAQRRR
ncbi:MAG TPA: class I SAM-dependent methyltransferase [Polyangia bacterium]|nr:class I SAM-dependent methyltransferase [Polyangia bacterium]